MTEEVITMMDLLMSETGFWVAFTILAMVVAMVWFFFKVMSLSKPKKE